MNNKLWRVGIPFVLVGASAFGACQTATNGDVTEAIAEARSSLFMENRGQWDAEALFYNGQPGLDYWVTRKGIVLDAYDNSPKGDGTFRKGQVVRLEFVSRSPGLRAQGVDRADTTSDFLIGDKSNHVRGVSSYEQAFVRNLYRGIDLRNYTQDSTARYDLMVHPGADPSDIAMNIVGADDWTITKKGDLRIETQVGPITQSGLKAYQIISGKRVEVSVEFYRRGEDQVGFKLGSYDPEHELVIDPLVYGSYVGSDSIPFISTGYETPVGVTSTADGSAYFVGETTSITFPLTEGPYGFMIQGLDGFLVRLEGDAFFMDYAAYIGGSGADSAHAVGVGENDTVLWMGGLTNSADFPGANNAIQGSDDVWILRWSLSSNGKLDPQFSMFVGSGGDTDDFGGLRVGVDGRVYVFATADNADLTGTPFLPGAGGGVDGYVKAFEPDGTLVYDVIVGGKGDDSMGKGDVDFTSNVVVTGTSPFVGNQHTGNVADPHFPTTDNVYSLGRIHRNGDAFVVKLSNTGETQFSALLGGSGFEDGVGVAFDTTGDVYVTGNTGSFNFPRTRAAYSFTGSMFATKISGGGGSILYSTRLDDTGGSNFPTAIDVDERGIAAIGGVVGWDPTNPTTPGTIPTVDPLDGIYGGGMQTFPPTVSSIPSSREGFIMFLNAAGSDLLFSDYIGENSEEVVMDVFTDGTNGTWVIGFTQVLFSLDGQNWTDPWGIAPYITQGAFKASPDFGSRDGFAIKLRVDMPIVDSLTLAPSDIPGGLDASTTATVTLRDPAPAPGVDIRMEITNPNIASFDPSGVQGIVVINIPGGQTQGTVVIYSRAVTELQTTDVFARLGNDFKAATLTVAPWLDDFILAPSVLPGGNTVLATVLLYDIAPVDITVVLDTSSSLLTLPDPPEIIIPAGTNTATAFVETEGVDFTSTAEMSATFLGRELAQVVVLTKAQLEALSFEPPRVPSGDNSLGRVQLNGKAGSDRVVTLTQISGPSGATFPDEVTILAGESDATFDIQTPAGQENTQITIEADDGETTVQGTLFIDQLVDIVELIVDPDTLTSGETANITVRINRAAGAGGFDIDLSSSNAAAGTLSSTSVTIPPGQSVSPIVTFTAASTTATITTDITASRPGLSSITKTITVNPPELLDFSIDPSSVVGGDSVTGFVEIDVPAPAGGIEITLTTDSPGEVNLPSSVTIPEGETELEFTFDTNSVASTVTAQITASIGGVSIDQFLEITPPLLLELTFDPPSVRGGQMTTGTVTIDHPAPVGGMTITIESLDPDHADVFGGNGTVFIAEGDTSGTFTAFGSKVSRTIAVEFVASNGADEISGFLFVRR